MNNGKTESKSKVEILVDLLREEADQLDRWAVESRRYGWSTHQVNPMRERASMIRAELIRAERSNAGDNN